MKPLIIPVLLLTATVASAQTWTTYDVSNSGIVTNNTIQVSFDTNGDVFANTQSGLSIKSGSTWTTHSVSTMALPNNNVSTSMRNGTDLWVGTDNGLACHNGTSWTTYNTSNSLLPDNRIYALTRTQSGIVWIGTRDGGICSYNGSVFTPISITGNINVNYNRAHDLVMDANGNLWIGTAGGGLGKYNTMNGTWSQYNTSNSTIPSNDVYAMDIAPDGKIWVGTSSGLGIFNPVTQTFTNILTTSNSMLPHNYVRGVAVDNGGRGYIATAYGGVARVETNYTISTVWNSSNSALPSDTIWHCNYNAGRLWVASLNEGIAVLDVDVNVNELIPSALSLAVSPSVTNGNTVLSIGCETATTTRIELISVTGQVVWTMSNVSVIPGELSRVTIPMEGLAAGQYIIMVTDDQQRRSTMKVIAE